jgi:hypothetical protein
MSDSYTADKFFQDETKRLTDKNDQATNLAESQQRLTLLNDSYRKRYAKYVQILMVLVLAYIAHLALTTSQKKFPVIPSILFDIAIILLIFTVAYYLYNAFTTLTARDPTNYDELNIPAMNNGSGVDSQKILNSGQLSTSSLDISGGICEGESCCPQGYDWDQDKNICVIKATGSSGSAYNPATGSYSSYTSTTNGAGKHVVTFDSFTTREYSAVNQQEVRSDDPSLKRSPDGGNIVPTYVDTSLEFSPLI